jgi:hypothetical protein
MGFKTASTLALFVAVLAVGAAFAQSPLPDPARTPGARNPAVTQEIIGKTICVRGWTRTVRPPSSFTSTLKHDQLRAWGYSDQQMSDFEEDHLIALELGGAPDDKRNLWPEPREQTDGWSADRKDALEGELNRLVCAGRVPLAEAQRAVSQDWTAAYRRFVSDAPSQGTSSYRPSNPSKAEPNTQCPGDVLVWVNTHSGVYHYPGSRNYGTTRSGRYLCERDASAEGDRASRSGD